MKKYLRKLGLGGVIAAALLLALDLPAVEATPFDDLVKSCMSSVKHECQEWAMQGGEMPRGLGKDTMVELAIGERYVLAGVVDIISGNPFLRIDFRKQPWLANRTRVKNPFYRIKDLPENWVKYRGRPVTMIGTARYTAFPSNGRMMLEIYIEPSPEPVIDALQRR